MLEDKEESNIVIEVSQPDADTLPFDYESVVNSFRSVPCLVVLGA